MRMAPEDKPIKSQEWHALQAEEVLRNLAVQSKGLTTEEARKRLQRFGPNQLQEAPRPTFLQTLWEQLNNFVVMLLIVASVISALLGDYVEAAAIMATPCASLSTKNCGLSVYPDVSWSMRCWIAGSSAE